MKAKFFEVEYTKKVGGIGTINVKGRNESEALTNAKNIIVTGCDFKVIKEVTPQRTAKGTGVAMGR